jgi:hypothetical protein
MKSAALALSVAMLFGAIAAAPVVAATTTMALPDCGGAPTVQPTSVIIFCGDAGITTEKLQWTGWGGTFAAAVGTATVNLCTPNCAAGNVKHYRVVLIATGRQHCSNGQSAYAKVSYAYIGPQPPNTDPDSSVTYTCK